MDFTHAFSAFAAFSFVLVCLLAFGTTYVIRTVVEAVWEGSTATHPSALAAKLWQKIFVPLGPMGNGALLGLIPALPWPKDLIGETTWGHVAFGFLGGMFANIVYARFRDWVRGTPAPAPSPNLPIPLPPAGDASGPVVDVTPPPGS